MQLEILTPKGIELKDEASVIVVPTMSGEISVLPKHVPIISVLKAGTMRIKTAQREVTREIEGGILEVAGESATILLKKF